MLKYGLAVAVVLRGIFIGLGSVAIEKYHSVLLVFAAILFFSSYKILFSGDDDGEEVMHSLMSLSILASKCIES